METARFDALSRTLSEARTRRGALAVLGGLAGLRLGEVAGKQRRRGRKSGRTDVRVEGTPALPSRSSGCEPLGPGSEGSGEGLQFCFEARGVEKKTESASGNFRLHYHSHVCYQVIDANGIVHEEGCFQDQNFLFGRHNNAEFWQVRHGNSRSEFSFESAGTTYQCTSEDNITIVDEEVRHNFREFVCNPPLP